MQFFQVFQTMECKTRIATRKVRQKIIATFLPCLPPKTWRTVLTTARCPREIGLMLKIHPKAYLKSNQIYCEDQWFWQWTGYVDIARHSATSFVSCWRIRRQTLTANFSIGTDFAHNLNGLRTLTLEMGQQRDKKWTTKIAYKKIK